MTLKIGFTGTQDGMTVHQRAGVTFALRMEFQPGAEFHHGNCIGADEEAATIALALGYRVVAHPPINTSKMSKMKWEVMLEPKEYMDRNHDIVDECDILIATPKTAHEIIRSGTWATLRYLKRFHPQKQLRFFFPNPVSM